MLHFSIPTDSKFFTLTTAGQSVLFAGSRHLSIDPATTGNLVSMLGSLGCSFITGCANGVDRSFRETFAESNYADNSFIACAFSDRVNKESAVKTTLVVPDGVPPRVALAKRTVWMVNRCNMAILFPSTPIGRGSNLCLQTAIKQGKPVFMVTDDRPVDTSKYWGLPSNLFGLIEGYWIIPKNSNYAVPKEDYL